MILTRWISGPSAGLTVICALSVIVAYELQFSPTQQIEAELSGFAPDVALEHLAIADAAGKLNDSLLVTMGDLALLIGDTDRARTVFERLAESHSLYATAKARLADMSASTGDLAAAAMHLKAAHDAAPNSEARARLGGWYRLLDDRAAERRLLASVAPADLTEFEALRLLDLERTAGRIDDIDAVLASLADLGGRTGHKWRLARLDFLLDTDRPGDARRAATAWWAEDLDAARLKDLVRTLLNRGAIDEATYLAEMTLLQYPSIAHPVLRTFIETGNAARAIALELRWLEALEHPDDGAWVTVTDVASATGDVRGIRALVERGGQARSDPVVVAAALEQVLRYKGAEAVRILGDALTPAVIAASPLLEAALAVDERRIYDTLSRAAHMPMTEWQADLWFAIARRLRGTAAWASLLSEIPRDSSAAAALLRSEFGAPLRPVLK